MGPQTVGKICDFGYDLYHGQTTLQGCHFVSFHTQTMMSEIYHLTGCPKMNEKIRPHQF